MPRPRGQLTKDQLAKEADIQLRNNARVMLQKWFVSVNKKIDQGDGRTMEMVGRMFQFDKGPGGVTIFNQHLQLNQNSGNGDSAGATRLRNFDQIVGRLEDQEAHALLNAPTENAESILEAEEILEDISEPTPEPAEAD